MRTFRSRAREHAGGRHGRPRLPAAALVISLTASACAFGVGRSGADASVEIRNTADVGVNMYMMPRVGLNEVFLGQVGPKSSRRIRVPRYSPGDTVWLRARPIDGGREYVRNDIVLGRQSVWRIP